MYFNLSSDILRIYLTLQKNNGLYNSGKIQKFEENFRHDKTFAKQHKPTKKDHRMLIKSEFFSTGTSFQLPTNKS